MSFTQATVSKKESTPSTGIVRFVFIVLGTVYYERPEIRFLDDTEIQESLVKAEFFFRFTNSIPRDFTVDFDFLSEQGELTYSTGTNVSSGDTQDPVITEFTETVEGDEITQLTMADRVVVSVTIPSSNASLQGALNLKSKTTYFLEITDRE